MSGISNEVLLALLIKKAEEKLNSIPDASTLKGLRGLRGEPGKDFVFSEHEETIRKWAKDFSLKFKDLSLEEVESLRGPKGKDGKDFKLEDNKVYFEDLAKRFANDFSLKFEDLNADQISLLRGPKGKDGINGKDFKWEDHKEKIHSLCKDFVTEIGDSLKLKFSDLTVEEISSLRGPQGKDGINGKDFNFEEHRKFFEGLKLSFSDLTAEDVSKLKLNFKDLTKEEKDSLKIKFENLTEDEKNFLRGPRGQRGRQGDSGESIQGDKGDKGDKGESIRGLPGPIGIKGFDGIDGQDGEDGEDGEDAPAITDVRIQQNNNQFYLIFDFSDGSEIQSSPIKLPAANIYVAGGGGASGNSGGGGGGASSAVLSGSWTSPNIINSSVTLTADPVLKFYLKGDSGPVAVDLPDGTVDQQVVEFVGTDDTDTVEFNYDDTDSTSNLKFSGPIVFKDYTRLSVSWEASRSKWVEISRNEI